MVIILLNTVEPPGATTAPQQPVFQNTKPFQSNHYIYMEPLVSNYFSYATATTFRDEGFKFSFVFNVP